LQPTYFFTKTALKMSHFTKKLLLILFLLPPAFILQAQSLSQTVIGSAGNFQTANSGDNLHWTVGEVAVERYENDLILGQGFHQMYYDIFITHVWDLKPSIELNLYPNPTAGWLRLENASAIPVKVMVTNLLGQQLLSTSADTYETDFDLAPYPNGLYLFSVLHNGRMIKSFKINKQSN
jgi:hypothetical protein